MIRHIAPGHSPKSIALRTMVRTEFEKGRIEKDEIKIEAMKASAIRALSNYMLYESGAKDAKLGKAMQKFNDDTNADAAPKVSSGRPKNTDDNTTR